MPTYACLLRVNASFILCAVTRFSLKILELTEVGFEVSFNSFFSSVTGLTSTLLCRFSMVVTKTVHKF